MMELTPNSMWHCHINGIHANSYSRWVDEHFGCIYVFVNLYMCEPFV